MMTEEEKKKACEDAKNRIAKQTVALATAISAVTPAMPNTPTAEQSPDFIPTPVEQRVSGMPSQSNITTIEEASTQPVFGSEEWLRTNVKQDCAEHETAVNALTEPQITAKDQMLADKWDRDMDEYLEKRQEITQTLQTPTTTDEYKGAIGNWSDFTATNYKGLQNYNEENTRLASNATDIKTSAEYLKYFRSYDPAKPIPNDIHEFLSFKNQDYVILPPEKNENFLEGSALGAFSFSDKNITLYNDYSNQEKALYEKNNDHQAEYIKGNPFAHLATLYHENVHKKHFMYDGMQELQFTPVNAAKADRLTETIANSTAYLAIALQYTKMKEQGIKTIQVPQTETFVTTVEKYMASPDNQNVPLQEYLKANNIQLAQNDEPINAENIPNLEQIAKHSILIKNASITMEDGEVDDLASYTSFAKNDVPFSETLAEWGVKSITINNEEIPVGELETKYPNIKEILQDSTKASEFYTNSLQEKPLESVLEMFPGLKEAIPETGFDPNNPEQVRAIVQASSDYWKAERLEGYKEQSLDMAQSATTYFDSHTWSEQMELLKTQDETYARVSERMLQNIYIGQNVSIDLSSCRDLLDTMNNEEANQLITQYNQNNKNNDEYITNPSLEEMQQIDAYLTSKGLTTDVEKMNYMSDFVIDAVTRTNNIKDPTLSAIIFTHNPHISYVDGLSVNCQDGLTAQDKLGLPYDVTNLVTLPQTLSADMQADRAQHDTDLNNQITALTQPAREAPTQQEVQTATQATNLSQIAMLQMQNDGR